MNELMKAKTGIVWWDSCTNYWVAQFLDAEGNALENDGGETGYYSHRKADAKKEIADFEHIYHKLDRVLIGTKNHTPEV